MFNNIEDIKKWLKEMSIYNYTIDHNLEVNVDRNVDLQHKNLTFIPVQFGVVKGTFTCRDNQLTSLKGSPRITLGFNCSHNQLDSLEYCPKEVNGYFDCSNNNLISLEKGPEFVGTSYDCSYNQIEFLPKMQDDINGYFDCSNNLLSSLENIPSKIKGSLYISSNNLTNFENIKIVGEELVANDNSINSIDYLPVYIGGDITFSSKDKLIEEINDLYIEKDNSYVVNFSFDYWKSLLLKNKLEKNLLQINRTNKPLKI